MRSTLVGEALREAEEALARVNRAATLGVLGASFAYELSQPLCAIVASAAACSRWLSAQPPNLDRAQRALERIAGDGRRAKEIIDGRRVFVERQGPHRDRFDLNEAILEVLGLTHDEVERNEISLETSLAEGLPAVESARTQVQQVILNLVVNAIQAMSAFAERPRQLAVGSSREGPNAVHVELRYSGASVDLRHADRLFKAFNSAKADGIGMGLSISRAIIEAYGGRLWVSPNQSHGAAFCISLPIGAAAA
jgi:C4-dicarboxylate-specific signal transduction histidine kinase